MLITTWLTGLLRHRSVRLTGSVIGVAMTVAVLGSLGTFFAASKAQMTKQAAAAPTRPVPAGSSLAHPALRRACQSATRTPPA